MPSIKKKELETTVLIVEFDPEWINDFGHPTGIIDWGKANLKAGQRAVGLYVDGKSSYHFSIQRAKNTGRAEYTWSFQHNMKLRYRGSDCDYDVYNTASGMVVSRYEQHWDGERWSWMNLYHYVRKHRPGLEVPRTTASFTEYAAERFKVIVNNRQTSSDRVFKINMLKAQKLIIRKLTKHFKDHKLRDVDESYTKAIYAAIKKLQVRATGKIDVTEGQLEKMANTYINNIFSGW